MKRVQCKKNSNELQVGHELLHIQIDLLEFRVDIADAKRAKRSYCQILLARI
jgi:hypothetical protein